MGRLFSFLMLFVFLACNNEVKEETTQNAGTPIEEATVENQSITDKKLDEVMNAYYGLKDALVEWDSSAINSAAKNLSSVIEPLANDSVETEVFRKYSGHIAAETTGLLGETDITEKRRAFSMISENLLSLLNDVKYKGKTVYRQTCPMAFNDNETANWLSNSSQVVNPYLGKKHPKYASGMLHCGEVTDTIRYR